jgi:hypothetical protein
MMLRAEDRQIEERAGTVSASLPPLDRLEFSSAEVLACLRAVADGRGLEGEEILAMLRVLEDSELVAADRKLTARGKRALRQLAGDEKRIAQLQGNLAALERAANTVSAVIDRLENEMCAAENNPDAPEGQVTALGAKKIKQAKKLIARLEAALDVRDQIESLGLCRISRPG